MPDNTDTKTVKEELLHPSSPSRVDDEKISTISLSDEDDGGKSSMHSIKSEGSSHSSKTSKNSNANTDNNQNKNIQEDSVKTDAQLKRIRQVEENETNDLKDKFMLKISNFPMDWDFSKVHAFLLKEYGPVNVVYMAGDDNPCCVLEFTSLSDCKTAQNALHDKVVEDERLIAEIRDSYTGDSDDETSPPRKKKRTRKVWRPDIDIWERDPHGLYGFTKEYLESLGIEPPIDRWVHVTNFRCDKSELKEAFELAGEVLLCCVDNRVPKSANVMYSHPIEAVQAVSMLNYQQFYGQVLKVSMQVCDPGTTFLPKGLSAVGPGLGCDGKPLRDIVKQFERFVRNKKSFVNSIVFSTPNNLSDSDADDEAPKKLSKIKTENSGSQIKLENAQSNSSITTTKRKTSVASSSNGSLSSPVPARTIPKSSGPNNPVRPILGPGPVGGKTGPLFVSGPKNVGLYGSSPVRPIGQNVGPLYPNTGVMGPVGPTHVPMCPNPRAMNPVRTPMLPNPMPMGLNARSVGPIGPNPGFMNPRPMGGPAFGPGPMPNGPQNVGPMYGPMAGPMAGPVRPMTQPSSADNYVTVELSNLPLSTTFPLLCEKMALCGQVMSIQLTAPGCAVVQFAQRMQAEKCFQQYNNCCILRNMVRVQFL